MQRSITANRILSVVLVAALLVLTAACGASSPTGSSAKQPTRKGSSNVLNWFGMAGVSDWVKTLDPATVTDSVSIYAIDMVNANLVKADYPSLKIVPDLASHWTLSPDHKTWTFFIRPNAKFANGDPVTAQDFVFSITRSLLPATKSPVAMTYLGHIVGAAAVNSGKSTTLTGVKAVNAHTLQITLDKPISYFLGTLSYPTADVLDPKVMTGKPAVSYLSNTCSANQGAGPFKFACLNKSSGKTSFYPSGHTPFMKFVPNPNYYGPKPKITVNAPAIPDADTNWRLYQAGSIDVTSVPTPDLSKAKTMPGFVQKAQLETDYITPNSQVAPFNNINCRLAVAYAIDREHITRDLLHGTELPLYDVLPPGLAGYFGKQSDVPSYNPAKAKKYLASCPGHLSNVTLPYQNTSSDITHEYDAIRANLQAIGANITIQPKTFNAWLNIVGQPLPKTRTQITENLWIDDYPDPQDWCTNLLHSGANYDIGGFSNPQYDSLVNQADTTFNTAKRAALYTQAQKIALKQGAWIGVGYAYAPYIINPKVHGLVASPSSIFPLHNNWANVTVSS